MIRWRKDNIEQDRMLNRESCTRNLIYVNYNSPLYSHSVLFITGDWKASVGSQETPGGTGKFGLGMRNEAGQRLTEFCQENALAIANTLFQQHKRRLHTMDITRWSTPKSDWLYSLQPKMEKLYRVNKNKTGSWLWLRSWNPYYQIQIQIEESRENH